MVGDGDANTDEVTDAANDDVDDDNKYWGIRAICCKANGVVVI